MNNDERYTSYQNMVTQVNTGLVQLEDVAEALNMEETKKTLHLSRTKLEERRFAVGILGEFNRGKSTVINSLLGAEIIPADILPTSATMNRVTYDMEPHVQLRMLDGSVKEIGIDELPRYVTKLDDEDEARAALVDEAVVYYPCKFCQNGVDIVDTPGLNDDARMNKITEEIIPKLDVVIMVLVPDSPLSQSEADFILNKLMTSDLGRLIFIVNKIDTIRRKQDRVRTVEKIKERIQQKVLERVGENYGADSEEYQDARRKLGQIQIFPMSALDALDGKLEGDQALIDGSGTVAFEQELTRMLTEERGALELGMPLNIMARSTQEMAKAIEMRKNALALSSQEFEEQQQAMLKQISEIRVQKTAEKKRLREKAASVRGDLTLQIADYYPQLKSELKEAVRETSIDPKTLSTKGGQDAAIAEIQKTVQARMEASVSGLTEKLEMQLRDIIGQEAVKLGNFTQSAADSLEKLKLGIQDDGSSLSYGSLAGIALDFAAGGFGIGGIVEGYRQAGFKGAAVGAVAGYAAELAVVNVLAALALPALPIVMITLVAGSVAGGAASKLLFKSDVGARKLEKIETQMEQNIDSMIDEMQAKGELEQWIRGRVDETFTELAEALDQECETMLKDTQHTMDGIKKDLLENEMQRKSLAVKYDQQLQTIGTLMQELKPISDKVTRILDVGTEAA